MARPSASRPYSYTVAERTLRNALHDLSILAGDVMGPSDATWQDVAGTAVLNLRALASIIEWAREGRTGSFPAFPSPAEALEAQGASE